MHKSAFGYPLAAAILLEHPPGSTVSFEVWTDCESAGLSWTVGEGYTITDSDYWTYCDGSFSMPSAGSSVTITGTDADNNSASETVVSQNTPTVTWSNPSAITYGTALSGTQLNATASYNGNTVAGTFAYSPPSGTVLGAGTQTLSVTFTPTDTTDYTTVTQTVSLVVNKATPNVLWASPSAIGYGIGLSDTQLNALATWTVGNTYGTVVGTYSL